MARYYCNLLKKGLGAIGSRTYNSPNSAALLQDGTILTETRQPLLGGLLLLMSIYRGHCPRLYMTLLFSHPQLPIFFWFAVNQFYFLAWRRYIVDNWCIAPSLHSSPLSYSYHITGTRILSYSRRFVSMFSPTLDHDSCVMFYQAGQFLLIPR